MDLFREKVCMEGAEREGIPSRLGTAPRARALVASVSRSPREASPGFSPPVVYTLLSSALT